MATGDWGFLLPWMDKCKPAGPISCVLVCFLWHFITGANPCVLVLPEWNCVTRLWVFVPMCIFALCLSLWLQIFVEINLRQCCRRPKTHLGQSRAAAALTWSCTSALPWSPSDSSSPSSGWARAPAGSRPWRWSWSDQASSAVGSSLQCYASFSAR